MKMLEKKMKWGLAGKHTYSFIFFMFIISVMRSSKEEYFRQKKQQILRPQTFSWLEYLVSYHKMFIRKNTQRRLAEYQ